MERAAKTTQIGEIRARFDKATAAVFLDYKGMTVDAATKLRVEFRKAGVEYKVVKNTLVRQALKEEKFIDQLSPALAGMTGIDGSVLNPKAVEDQLATMPGKDELRGMLLATFQAPLQQFVALLQAPTQNLVYVLAAKEKQDKEKA